MFFDIFREHVGHFEAIQFLCTPSLVKTKLFLFFHEGFSKAQAEYLTQCVDSCTEYPIF